MAKIKQRGQESDAITEGNQKWHGGTPIFIKIPIVNEANIVDLEREVSIGFKERDSASRINPDPSAWARKYLMAPSVS